MSEVRSVPSVQSREVWVIEGRSKGYSGWSPADCMSYWDKESAQEELQELKAVNQCMDFRVVRYTPSKPRR